MLLMLVLVLAALGAVLALRAAWSGGSPDADDQSAAAGADGGLFGFPQDDAQVLCDRPDLRVSAWNDAAHLFVQAIMRGDGDAAAGEGATGADEIDWSMLCVDADADGADTADVDRIYSINPLPTRTGLQYQVYTGEERMTHLRDDSAGRGSVVLVEDRDHGRVRVDTYAIPLAELGRVPGERLRLVYWGRSPSPEITLNSTGYHEDAHYFAHRIPRAMYHDVPLAQRDATLDPTAIPEGAAAPPPRPVVPHPEIDSVPPSFSAEIWINVSTPPTLESLRGNVVLIEFWSTNCGRCVDEIPGLNDLHDRFEPLGLRIVALAPQGRRGVDHVMKRAPIRYPVGAGSDSKYDYGVVGAPYTFLIDRDGAVAWHGRVSIEMLERIVETLLDQEV